MGGDREKRLGQKLETILRTSDGKMDSFRMNGAGSTDIGVKSGINDRLFILRIVQSQIPLRDQMFVSAKAPRELLTSFYVLASLVAQSMG